MFQQALIPASHPPEGMVPYVEIHALQQLLHEGTAMQTDFFEPGICDCPVLAIHKQRYE
jgi:hypothetical protein